jgi:dimethylhistidine N-methyltransferase
VVHVPRGVARPGLHRATHPRLGWDNEYEAHDVEVGAFDVDRFPVTNQDFLRFVESGGYAQASWWSASAWAWRSAQQLQHPATWRRDGSGWRERAFFSERPLDLRVPVQVSHAEASAYAAWRGARLMTELEWHRAALGAPDGSVRDFPWGAATPQPGVHGTFGFSSFDALPVGATPAGRSAFGVDELVGNGWEWTSTVFAPFAGFEALPFYRGYSANFFDGKHFVLKGASAFTDVTFLRASFRNWFQPHYPHVFAKFRCVMALAKRVLEFRARRRRRVTSAAEKKLVLVGRDDARKALATAVSAGLRASPKRLPAALLYDDLGSALFDAITLLPEYEVTRADLRLLERHGAQVAELLPARHLVELGPGSGAKAALFLSRWPTTPLRFTAIDVSEAALRMCRRTLAPLEHVHTTTLQADYLEGLARLEPGSARRLVLFLGSNLSNFERGDAAAFIAAIAATLRPGDGVLLATDLDKPASVLVPAYDDAAGVTAAFNRNLLVRLNRELDGDFDVRAFRHEARWSDGERRIEMHLVATRAMEVTLRATGEVFSFAAGESLWTESSHRFRAGELREWGRAAGLETKAQWVDPAWAFAHTLFMKE